MNQIALLSLSISAYIIAFRLFAPGDGVEPPRVATRSGKLKAQQTYLRGRFRYRERQESAGQFCLGC